MHLVASVRPCDCFSDCPCSPGWTIRPSRVITSQAVCLSVISGCIWLIARMRSIGFNISASQQANCCLEQKCILFHLFPSVCILISDGFHSMSCWDLAWSIVHKRISFHFSWFSSAVGPLWSVWKNFATWVCNAKTCPTLVIRQSFLWYDKEFVSYMSRKDWWTIRQSFSWYGDNKDLNCRGITWPENYHRMVESGKESVAYR